jgi:hypothetical protein
LEKLTGSKGPKLRLGKVPPPQKEQEPVAPPPVVEEPEAPTSPSPRPTWLKLKPILLNAGRLEISITYPVAILVGLLVIVAVLVIFRLGRLDGRASTASSSRRSSTADGGQGASPEDPSQASSQTAADRGQVNQASGEPQRGAAANLPDGYDHVIVMAFHTVRSQLEPVQAYFTRNGITTTIVPLARMRELLETNGLDASRVRSGEGFLLVSGVCPNPESEGTIGYELKQKIIRLGADYEAPPSFETFATHRFSDAYGMKVFR